MPNICLLVFFLLYSERGGHRRQSRHLHSSPGQRWCHEERASWDQQAEEWHEAGRESPLTGMYELHCLTQSELFVYIWRWTKSAAVWEGKLHDCVLNPAVNWLLCFLQLDRRLSLMDPSKEVMMNIFSNIKVGVNSPAGVYNRTVGKERHDLH